MVTPAELVDEWWSSKPRLTATTRTKYREYLEKHIGEDRSSYWMTSCTRIRAQRG